MMRLDILTGFLFLVLTDVARADSNPFLFEESGRRYLLDTTGTECTLLVKRGATQEAIPLGILTPCDALRYGAYGGGGYSIKRNGDVRTLRVVGALRKLQNFPELCGFQWRTIRIASDHVTLDPFALTEAAGYCPYQEYPKAW